MYHETELRNLYDRLGAQYPQYELSFSGDHLTISRLHSKAEVSRKGAELYANGTLYDQFTSDEVEDPDDLYELIELFFLDIQHFGMTQGNETYIAAQKKAAKLGTRFLILAGALFTACLLPLMAAHSLWLILPVFAGPAISLVALAMIYKNAFRLYWICPACGRPLPLDPKSRFPKMEYVPQCPHCGHILEQEPELEPVRLETNEQTQPLDPSYIPPAKGKKWPCLFTGSVTIAMSLFLFVILFFFGDPLEAQNAGMTMILLLVLSGFGLTLLLCRHTETENIQQPLAVLREQKMVTGVGILVWLIGLVVMFMAIAVAVAVPVDAATCFLALAGVSATFFGVWMVLAGRNRSLFVFRDNSILYISSWGRQKEFAPGQVASVKLTINRSIHLLDKNGKKLVSVETNMQGISRFVQWIENSNLTAALTPSMEKQAKQQAETAASVQWREEYRTHWHDHIKAIRTGMWLVLFFFAAGTIAPIPLFLFAGVKFRTLMIISALAPVPFLVFCLVFAPVLLFDDRPANATPEWNSMHIKVPLIPALLIGLLYMGQVHYIWDGLILQEPDGSWLWLIRVLTIGTALTVLLIRRTPRRLRLGTGIFMGMMSFCLAIGFHYYVNAALCGPARHYPAVIVDSHAKDPDIEDDDYTLTIQMDNGKEATIAVLEEIYEQAIHGEPLDVCHRESPLGVSLLDIHAPKKEKQQ